MVATIVKAILAALTGLANAILPPTQKKHPPRGGGWSFSYA